MKLVHRNTNTVLGENIKTADSFVSRLVGLMFKNEMSGMDGLLIKDCRSIHNCFVRFPIDAVFLNNKFEVVKVLRNFRPWRFSWVYIKATQVLELPVNTVPPEVNPGDIIEVVNV